MLCVVLCPAAAAANSCDSFDERDLTIRAARGESAAVCEGLHTLRRWKNVAHSNICQ